MEEDETGGGKVLKTEAGEEWGKRNFTRVPTKSG
jgi:hypothetical protein